MYKCTVYKLANEIWVHVCTINFCLSVCVQEAKEHYEMIKEDYQKQVQKLTQLVDSAVDPVDFMKASGEPMLLVCGSR